MSDPHRPFATPSPFDPEPLDAVPVELRERRQWVCFKLLPPPKPGKKPRKIPIDAKTGGAATTTDPATWAPFEEARDRAARSPRLAGIGFVFTQDDPYVGVDLDECRDAITGELAEWALATVEALDSYTEVSFSNTGVHVLVRGRLPPGGRKKDHLEMYETARYFVVTGLHLAETPATIEERTEALAAIHAVTFAKEKEKQPAPKPARTVADLTDDELLAKARAAKNGAKFDALSRGDTSGYPSPSEADMAYCGQLAFWTGGDTARMDALFRRSGLMRPKWDEMHGEWTYGETTISKALESRTEFYTPAGASGGEDEDGTFTSQLVSSIIGRGVELFHDNRERPYASVPVGGHVETMPLGSARFKSWISRISFREFHRAATSNVVSDVRATLTGIALHEGVLTSVFVRIGELDGRIYLDLGRPEWDAIEITAAGWRLVPTPPVRFRRPAGFAALPLPVEGGTLTELRPFINCTDTDWPLILAWTVTACRPRGPYPVLVVTGPHGSAKSTLARLLRLLIDPNTASLRSQPSGDRDLMISASNSWLQTFDNLSSITAGMSDAFCRLATGGGYATRTLYTDDDEMIFDVQRPVSLTGIEEVVTRSDLLDRSLLIYCPEIPEEERRDEEALLAAFEAARRRLLGALLTAVTTGLRDIATVQLDRLPRMADFARWAVACEPGTGLAAGAFLAAYRGNQEAAVALSLEANPVACAVRDMVFEKGDTIRNTASGLLAAIDLRRGNERPPRDWPQTPKAFSGALRRGMPSLKAIGIGVAFTRETDGKRTRWITLTLAPKNTVRIVRDRPATAPTAAITGVPADGVGRNTDAGAEDAASEAAAPEPAQRTPPGGSRTHPDGSDADLGGSPDADSVRAVFADAMEVDADAERRAIEAEGSDDA